MARPLSRRVYPFFGLTAGTRSAGSLCAVLIAVASTTFSGAQQPPAPTDHAVTLTRQSADALPDGTVVVTSVATGDLKGMVTLTLRPAGDGTFAGEWAFTVAHVDHADPATGVEPVPEEGHEGHQHHDFVTFVRRGALSGAVASAQVTFDAEGLPTTLTAPLAIGQGSLEFEGKTGSGQATLSTLTLRF
jgi:hypothetical protein